MPVWLGVMRAEHCGREIIGCAVGTVELRPEVLAWQTMSTPQMSLKQDPLAADATACHSRQLNFP